jgi:hypothetical protein
VTGPYAVEQQPTLVLTVTIHRPPVAQRQHTLLGPQPERAAPATFAVYHYPPPSQRVTSSNRHVRHRPSANWRLLDVTPWRLVGRSSPSSLFLQAVVSCGQATRCHVLDDSNVFIVIGARAANPTIKLFVLLVIYLLFT